MKTYGQVKSDMLYDLGFDKSPCKFDFKGYLKTSSPFALRGVRGPQVEYIFKHVATSPQLRSTVRYGGIFKYVYSVSVPSQGHVHDMRNIVWSVPYVETGVHRDTGNPINHIDMSGLNFGDFMFCDRHHEDWEDDVECPFNLPWIRRENEKSRHIEKLDMVLKNYQFPDVDVIGRLMFELTSKKNGHLYDLDKLKILELNIKKDNSALYLRFTVNDEYYNFSIEKDFVPEFDKPINRPGIEHWRHQLEFDITRGYMRS